MQYNFFVHAAADYVIVIVVSLAAIAMLRVPAERRYQVWARAIVAGLVALLFAKTASMFYQGERPFEALGVMPGATFLPNPGFPSDHALLVFTATFIVWASTKNVIISSALLVLSLIVAVGRVLALVHTPLDITGGFVCALLAVICLYGRRFFTNQQ